MKIKEGFRLRTIMGRSVVVAEGIQQIDYSKLISLNESAALLWAKAEEGDFTVDTLAQVLVDEYGIDPEQALADTKMIVDKWIEVGLAQA